MAGSNAADQPRGRSDADLQFVPVSFDGRGAEYWWIWLLNQILTIASFGIYLPWARLHTRTYFYDRTRLLRHGFCYAGQGLPLFIGWVVVGFGIALLGATGDLLTAGVVAAVETILKPPQGAVLAASLGAALTLAAQVMVYSWLLVQSLRYNASQTTYRNLRFGFGRGERRRDLVFEMLILLVLRFLVPFTFGLLQPYVAWLSRRFLISHRRFGTTPFTFTATPSDFYRLHIRFFPLLLLAVILLLLAVILLVPAVIGLGLRAGLFAGLTAALTAALKISPVMDMLELMTPHVLLPAIGLALLALLALLFWSCQLEARAARLTWENTQLGDLRFCCNWLAGDLLWMGLMHGLLLVVTLGLALPVVRVWAARYRLSRIGVSPAAALDGFVAAEQVRVSALAEGGLAELDALAGLLDFGF